MDQEAGTDKQLPLSESLLCSKRPGTVFRESPPGPRNKSESMSAAPHLEEAFVSVGFASGWEATNELWHPVKGNMALSDPF